MIPSLRFSLQAHAPQSVHLAELHTRLGAPLRMVWRNPPQEGKQDCSALGHAVYQSLLTGDASLRWKNQQAGILAACKAWGYDANCLPADITLAQIGLVAMDMDSTLITIECIDEMAICHGVGEQVVAVTERSMRGEIDFSTSLRERVALLQGMPAAQLDEIYTQRLQLTAGAERMLSALQKEGAQTLLISGGFTYFTEKLRARLRLTHAVANTLAVDTEGRLTGQLLGAVIDAQAKADRLRALAARLPATQPYTLALGDGANDIPMLGAADFGIAFHAKPKTRAAAHLALDQVGLDGVLGLFPDPLAKPASATALL